MLAEQPGCQRGQRVVLCAVREQCKRGENGGGPARSDVVLVLVSIEQLSESLGDGVATRRISEDARSGFIRKEAQNASLFLSKKLFCKEALGNACIKRL